MNMLNTAPPYPQPGDFMIYDDKWFVEPGYWYLYDDLRRETMKVTAVDHASNWVELKGYTERQRTVRASLDTVLRNQPE